MRHLLIAPQWLLRWTTGTIAMALILLSVGIMLLSRVFARIADWAVEDPHGPTSRCSPQHVDSR